MTAQSTIENPLFSDAFLLKKTPIGIAGQIAVFVIDVKMNPWFYECKIIR